MAITDFLNENKTKETLIFLFYYMEPNGFLAPNFTFIFYLTDAWYRQVFKHKAYKSFYFYIGRKYGLDLFPSHKMLRRNKIKTFKMTFGCHRKCPGKFEIKLCQYKWLKFFTQRNIFEILLNQPEIRLYLLVSDWFGSKRTSVSIQISQKMVNTIWFQFDLIRFWKDFFCVFFINYSLYANVQHSAFQVMFYLDIILI